VTAREVAGLVALDAALLALGSATVYGLGLVRSGRSAFRYCGLALFLGWAELGLAGSFLAVTGASLALWQILLLAAALTAAGLVLSRFVAPATVPPALREAGAAAWVAAAGAAVAFVYLEALFRRSKLAVTQAWDAQAFWVPKAAVLVYQGGLHARPTGFTSFTNQDYPLFAPVQDAITFRFLGSVDPAGLPTQHLIIAAAFVAAIAAVLADRVRPLVLWPGLAALVLMPGFGDLVGSSLGDEPLALLLAFAGVCVARWLVSPEPRWLAVAGLCTTAAAVTKIEGLPGALLVAVLLVAASRLRAWRAGLALLAAPVAAVVPWRIWMHAHHIHPNSAFPYSKLLDAGYLGGRLGRLGTALADLPGYLLGLDRWLLAVPAALLLALLVVRRRPALTVLVLGTALLAFLGNAAIYWISPLDIHFYIDTSAARVVSSTTLFCAAVAPLLLSEALGDDR
jgi:hypothetical protein